jgi:hypothetical protein
MDDCIRQALDTAAMIIGDLERRSDRRAKSSSGRVV